MVGLLEMWRRRTQFLLIALVVVLISYLVIMINGLGIGLNDGIPRPLRNVLFDEKLDGTIHLALGDGFTHLGGTNRSAVHADLIKDLKVAGSRIEADGEVVCADGRWLV